MKKLTLVLLSLFGVLTFSQAQNYVDVTYQIENFTNVTYGKATDVAGNVRDLQMDISYPTNDSVKSCGRPLMIIVHGGAFMSGDKNEASITTLREEFAKRGYVTASVNYRLGMFHTDKLINCNVSSLGASWNCLNMTDTSEWYRAYYRGIQDVHGAIRYLVNNRTIYKPNSNNVFVIGQSAGGFIALGVGFIDDSSEVDTALISSMDKANPPHRVYENDCIIARGLDTSIEKMDVTRPHLGNYWGDLNPPLQNTYTIRGVGNFYGGVFNNIFESHSKVTPVLYMYHQPNDLIVPIGTNRVFAGFNACAMSFPFNCQGIVNRPMMHGSKAIVSLIDTAKAQGKNVPIYQFDVTNNNANCATQIANPSTTGHAFDNFTLRRSNMAKSFAKAIDTCSLNGVNNGLAIMRIKVSPNPIRSGHLLRVDGWLEVGSVIELLDVNGKLIQKWDIRKHQMKTELAVSGLNMVNGIYPLRISSGEKTITKRIVFLD
jgi:acetyl esterase/lipase